MVFVRSLNAALEGAGMKGVCASDPIGNLMSSMPAIGALGGMVRNRNLRVAFPAASSQLLAYAPENMTFEQANPADGGKYFVYCAQGEKYRLELPPALVDSCGNPLTGRKGEPLTPKNARNYAFSITLGDIAGLAFDNGRQETILLAKGIKLWFAMPMPRSIIGFARVEPQCGRNGVLAGLREEGAPGESGINFYMLCNFFNPGEKNWLGLPAIGSLTDPLRLRMSITANHGPLDRLGGLATAEGMDAPLLEGKRA